MKLEKQLILLLLIAPLFLIDSCSRLYRSPDLPTDDTVARYSSDSMKLVNRSYADIINGDDLTADSLRRAIEQTLRYYDKIPPDRQFKYGRMTYSAREVGASMRLFLELLERTRGQEELVAEVQKSFFIFESVANRQDRVMLTGYYEPLFKGSLEASPDYPVPMYGVPDDLRVLDLERFRESLKYRTIVYRMLDGRLIPYHTRKEIMERRALAGKAEILAWMADPIDLFFLQVQGSGILELPSGKRMKVSYAGSNGRAYSSIGKLLVEEGKLVLEEVSMGRIREYLNNHPEELKRVLYHNRSYTFFNIAESQENPRGSLNVPLTPHRSVALDVTIFPKGSLGYLVAEKPHFDDQMTFQGLKPFSRFILAQDTGGAIKGPDRVDVFWGSGQLAEKSAGVMRTFGNLYFIIAKKEALQKMASYLPAD